MAATESPIAINDLVEIELTEGPMAGRYRSRVEGISEGQVELAAPLYRAYRVLVPVGATVTVHALKADPVRGARFAGVCTVLGHRDEGDVSTLSVSPPQWQRVQLRSYVRVEATLPVRFRLREEPERGGDPWVEAETRDVGGGGLMIRSPVSPREGAILDVTLSLPGTTVDATAEVIRVISQAEETGHVGLAVKFIEILESNRDRIIRFILRRQAELRRMGLV